MKFEVKKAITKVLFRKGPSKGSVTANFVADFDAGIDGSVEFEFVGDMFVKTTTVWDSTASVDSPAVLTHTSSGTEMSASLGLMFEFSLFEGLASLTAVAEAKTASGLLICPDDSGNNAIGGDFDTSVKIAFGTGFPSLTLPSYNMCDAIEFDLGEVSIPNIGKTKTLLDKTITVGDGVRDSCI